MNLTVKNLVNLTFFFSVFCFFAFVPFITAEVQPFAFFFSLFGLIFFKEDKKKKLYLFLWSIYLFISFIFEMLDYGFYKYSILTFVSLLIPITIFFFLKDNINKIKVTVFNYCFFSWTLISFLQYFLPQVLDTIGISSILKFFVRRYSNSALLDWGRGVVAFSPEPSYSAHIIFLFLIFILYFKHKNLISNSILVLYYFCLALLVFTNGSGTIGVNLVLFLFLLFIFNFRFKPFLILVFMLSIVFYSFNDLRVVYVTKELINSLLTSGKSTFNVFTALGSTREFSVSVSYSTLFQGNYFGYGLGSWSHSFIDIMNELGFDPSFITRFKRDGIINLKPYSYVGVIIFDLGLLGLTFFCFILYKILKIKEEITSMGKSIVIFSLIMLFFHTLLTLPAYWITLAVGLNFNKKD